MNNSLSKSLLSSAKVVFENAIAGIIAALVVAAYFSFSHVGQNSEPDPASPSTVSEESVANDCGA